MSEQDHIDSKCNWPPIYPSSTHSVTPPAAGTIDFATLIWPDVVPGYVAVLKSVTFTAVNTSLTPNQYDAGVAPEWLAAFLDPSNANIPASQGDFVPLAALRGPFDANVPFFEQAGVFGIVNETNGGRGHPFPFYSYKRHWPLLLSARGIGTTCRIGITPVIEYEKRW